MSLSKVEITNDVFWTCLSHAHTSEKEEVMGLLLGHSNADDTQSRIWMAIPLSRIDRRKDRVECSPEQLTKCTQMAEELSKQTKQKTQVLGWYHSHPHTTVLPSHVDVKTQAHMQRLDPAFVGIIVSCFNDDPQTMEQTVKIHAFQSIQNSQQMSTVSPAGSVGDSDKEMQAAIQASMEQHGQQWVRKDVPIVVTKPQTDLERNLGHLLAIPEILKQEEKKQYEKQMELVGQRTSTSDSSETGMHQVYFSSVYNQHLIKLMDSVLLPQLEAIKLKRLQTSFQRRQLQSELTELLKEKERRAQAAVNVQRSGPLAFFGSSQPQAGNLIDFGQDSFVTRVEQGYQFQDGANNQFNNM